MSNFVTRLAVALVGIPVLLWIFWQGTLPLISLIIVLQLAALFEWTNLLHAKGVNVSKSGLLVAAAGGNCIVLTAGDEIGLGIGLLLLSAWLLNSVFRQDDQQLEKLGSSALFLLYISLPLGLWYYLSELDTGSRFTDGGPLVLLFVATWFCDSGAYFVGRAIGKHKLLERASPNKTVEGFVGGILFSAIPLPLAAALGWATPGILDYVALPAAVGLFGQAGDLLESLMKREAGVKDSSRMIPGHGGVLDRFDSLLLSTPVFYAFLVLFS